MPSEQERIEEILWGHVTSPDREGFMRTTRERMKQAAVEIVAMQHSPNALGGAPQSLPSLRTRRLPPMCSPDTGPIPETIAEARVGDQIWYRADPWRNRSGVMALVPVVRLGRDYLYVTVDGCEYGFSRGHGTGKPDRGFTGQGLVFARRERILYFARDLAPKVGDAFRACRDPAALNAVLHALNLPEIPDA